MLKNSVYDPDTNFVQNKKYEKPPLLAVANK